MYDRIVKSAEAARLLGISKDQLLSLEREGRIPEFRRDEYGNRIYNLDEIEKLRELLQVRPKLKDSTVILAVFNMKGGVGKSTISSNLAWRVAEKGYRTLAIDADPQGHMTTSLGQEPSDFKKTLMEMLIPDTHKEISEVAEVRFKITPTLDLVAANLSMCSMNLMLFQQPEREYRFRRSSEKLRKSNDYDIIIVDSPPSYDLTSLNILLACDFLLAPVKLDGNSFYGLQYLFDSIHDISKVYRYEIPIIRIVANHYNGSYTVSRQILDGLKENYGPYVLNTVIRQDVGFDKANALRQPIFVQAPTGKGCKDMESLTAEVLSVLNTTNPARFET